MSARAPYIAVIGPGDADAETCADAARVGRAIAGRGGVVVCGGLGGVMAAAARGAAEGGGLSVGILPGEDRAQAAEHLTVALATGLGELRNGLIVRASDAVVAVGGSWGTLSELALALRIGRPLASLRGWTIAAQPLPQADSPEAAVDAVFAALAAP